MKRIDLRETIIFCLLAGTSILAISRPFEIPILNQPALTGLFYVIYSLETASMTLQAGAFILIIGLIDLARKIVGITRHVDVPVVHGTIGRP